MLTSVLQPTAMSVCKPWVVQPAVPASPTSTRRRATWVVGNHEKTDSPLEAYGVVDPCTLDYLRLYMDKNSRQMKIRAKKVIPSSSSPVPSPIQTNFDQARPLISRPKIKFQLSKPAQPEGACQKSVPINPPSRAVTPSCSVSSPAMISDFKTLVSTMKNAKSESMKRRCSPLKSKPNSPFSSLRAVNVYLSSPSKSDSDGEHTPTRLSFLPNETDSGPAWLNISTRFNSLNGNSQEPKILSKDDKADDSGMECAEKPLEDSNIEDLESPMTTKATSRRKPIPSWD